jgi:hypothetical protein
MVSNEKPRNGLQVAIFALLNMRKLLNITFNLVSVLGMLLLAIFLTFMNLKGSPDELHLHFSYGVPCYFYMVHDFGEIRNGQFIPETSWRWGYLALDIVVWITLVFGAGFAIDRLTNRKKRKRKRSS